jgi:hypothetical protein
LLVGTIDRYKFRFRKDNRRYSRTFLTPIKRSGRRVLPALWRMGIL